MLCACSCVLRPASLGQSDRRNARLCCEEQKAKASSSRACSSSRGIVSSPSCFTVFLPFFCNNPDLLRLLGQTGLCAIGEITLSEPLTGLDDLDNIDPLLEQHDGS